MQYAVQIHDPEEPMIDGKVVAHHPFLSNEAQLRLAAARDRRDADYADAIVDRRPIRSARTRAIPDSPRSTGVASLIYPEPEMIRRAAAKAMDPINQRLSLIVPPTAVGGTCDPLRAAIIRLMPHDRRRLLRGRGAMWPKSPWRAGVYLFPSSLLITRGFVTGLQRVECGPATE